MGRMKVEKGDLFYEALAHPCRRQIICMLREEGDMSAGEIGNRFDMAQSSVSRHLSILEHAGIIRVKRIGKNRIYSYSRYAAADISYYIGNLLYGEEE